MPAPCRREGRRGAPPKMPITQAPIGWVMPASRVETSGGSDPGRLPPSPRRDLDRPDHHAGEHRPRLRDPHPSTISMHSWSITSAGGCMMVHRRQVPRSASGNGHRRVCRFLLCLLCAPAASLWASISGRLKGSGNCNIVRHITNYCTGVQGHVGSQAQMDNEQRRGERGLDRRLCPGRRAAYQDLRRKKEADAYAQQIGVDIRAGIHTPVSKSITVAQAAEDWIKSIELEGREASTLAQYRQHARHITDRIGSLQARGPHHAARSTASATTC